MLGNGNCHWQPRWPLALSTWRRVRSARWRLVGVIPMEFMLHFVSEKSSHVGVIPAFYPMAFSDNRDWEFGRCGKTFFAFSFLANESRVGEVIASAMLLCCSSVAGKAGDLVARVSRTSKSRPWGPGLVGFNRVRSTRLAWGAALWRQRVPGLTTSAIESNARRRKAQP